MNTRSRWPLDLRAMLIEAGVGQATAVVAIPLMNMLPSTCEPYAQGTLLLCAGLQRLLNQRGARLEEDGGLGPATIAAVRFFAGPRWFDKSWAQLYADVLSNQPWEEYGRNSARTPGLADFQQDLGVQQDLGTSFFGDVVASPLPLIGAAALGIWLWKQHKRRRGRA